MKYITKTAVIGMIVVSTIISGCNKTKAIILSENVKNDLLLKADENKIKSEPILKKKLNGLNNQLIYFWIDDENILTAEKPKENIILNSYNLESEKSTEILNDRNIERIYDKDENGVVLLGNNKQAFIYNVHENKLQKVLEFNEEFKNGIPGSKFQKDQQNLLNTGLKLINKDYVSYISKVKSKGMVEYTILNYKDNKKYNIEINADITIGMDCKFDFTGKNLYIGETNKITKFNLETGEKSSMELRMPKIKNVFEDGTLFVYCPEENKKNYEKKKVYKVDFDKKELIKYDQNYKGKNLNIEAVDFKNQFVNYTYEEDRKNTAMYGKIEGNKFVVTDRLFKNGEYDCSNPPNHFIFSSDHNKFICGLRYMDKRFEMTEGHEYLFELK